MKEKTKKFLKGLCTAAEIVIGSAVSFGAGEIGKIAFDKYIKPYAVPKNKFAKYALYGGGIALASVLGTAAYKSVQEVTTSISEAIDKAEELKKFKEKIEEFNNLLSENKDNLTLHQLLHYAQAIPDCKTSEEIEALIFELKADVINNEAEDEEETYDEQPG